MSPFLFLGTARKAYKKQFCLAGCGVMVMLKKRFQSSFIRDSVLFMMLLLLLEAILAAHSDAFLEVNGSLPANESLASGSFLEGKESPPANESLASDAGAADGALSPVYVPLNYGLVAYWDGSGSNGKSDDISGHGYAAALGGTAFQSKTNNLNGVYINSTPASAQAGATWTKSDDGVFDAVGDGNKAFAFSFWYVTSSAETEDQLVNFVGSDYGDVTHSPFIIMSGNYGGGTWFWRGYNSQRNNIDMAYYADGRWHNVILTENENGAYAYIDGKSVGAAPLYTGDYAYSTGWNLTFGCRQALNDNDTQCALLEFSPNHGYMGNLGIDEIAFWNRSFTVNDVVMLYYNGTNGTFCTGNPCTFLRNKKLAYKFK